MCSFLSPKVCICTDSSSDKERKTSPDMSSKPLHEVPFVVLSLPFRPPLLPEIYEHSDFRGKETDQNRSVNYTKTPDMERGENICSMTLNWKFQDEEIRPSFNLYHRTLSKPGLRASRFLIPAGHSEGAVPKQCVEADLSRAADGRAPNGGCGVPWQVPGTLRAAPESQHTSSRIHVDPSVRLLKEGGLLGVPSPRDTLGTPKVHKTHIPSHKELVVWVLGAFLFSTVACPHRQPSIRVVEQGWETKVLWDKPSRQGAGK